MTFVGVPGVSRSLTATFGHSLSLGALRELITGQLGDWPDDASLTVSADAGDGREAGMSTLKFEYQSVPLDVRGRRITHE